MSALRVGLLCTGAFFLSSNFAAAGGLSLGSAKLDPLFSEGFGITSGNTYVVPNREYDKITGSHIVGGTQQIFTQTNMKFSNNMAVPYLSVGGELEGPLSCLGSYAQPYGRSKGYTGAAAFHLANEEISSEEYGMTCAIAFDLPGIRLTGFAGGFQEKAEIHQSRDLSAAYAGQIGLSSVDMSSETYGYRVGANLLLEDLGISGRITYRSKTEHDFKGDFTNMPFRTSAPFMGSYNAAQLNNFTIGGLSGKASASVVLPQQVELSMKAALRDDLLVFGSVKWTDWSVLNSIRIFEGINNTQFATIEANYTDGWTVQAGAAHVVAENMMLTGSLTWDKGVFSNYDVSTDTWSLAGSGSYKMASDVEINLGGGVHYYTSGTKSNSSHGLAYTAHAKESLGYSVSLAANFSF